MATVKEKDLPLAVSLSSSDYIRIVTSSGASQIIGAGDVGLGSMADFVVEEGTTTAGSVSWKYRKWHSGELEMWGTATTTLAIATASGSLYTTASTYSVAMPSFVSGLDFITGELSGGGWVDFTDVNNPPYIRLYAPTSYGSASRVLKYYFKGTWA